MPLELIDDVSSILFDSHIGNSYFYKRLDLMARYNIKMFIGITGFIRYYRYLYVECIVGLQSLFIHLNRN